MTKEQILADVRHEIDALKQNATAEEISKLNLETFNYAKPHSCIYGQMTGDCESIRAKELMDASCIRVMDLKDGTVEIENVSIYSEDFKVNGQYEGQTWLGEKYDKGCIVRTYKYMSILEGYICTLGANISGIISYMKGETNELTL